jgi:hypothetical protein
MVHALGRWRSDLELPPTVPPRPRDAAASAEDAMAAAHWLAASRARLQPSACDAVLALREAAALRERGVIDEREFGLLKERLLQAA